MAKRRKGRVLASIIAALVFVVGVGCILYPYVSDWVHKLDQSRIIRHQQEIIKEEDESSLSAELQQCIDYNTRLLDNRTVLTDPFDPNNQPVTAEEYEARLNLAGDGVMGDIVIPKIKVKVPIYHSTTEDVLQKGAGHLEGTSLPVGGENTHCVVAGHNGLPSVRIFDDIGKLKVGDYFVVQVLGEDHAYSITSTEVVLPEETDSLVIEHGQDLVTLVTCTPYGVNTHRLLVHGKRTDLPDEWLNRDSKNTDYVITDPSQIPLWVFTLAGFGFAGLFFPIFLLMKRRRKKQQRIQEQALGAAETAAQIADLAVRESPSPPRGIRRAPSRLSRRELAELQERSGRRESAGWQGQTAAGTRQSGREQSAAWLRSERRQRRVRQEPPVPPAPSGQRQAVFGRHRSAEVPEETPPPRRLARTPRSASAGAPQRLASASAYGRPKRRRSAALTESEDLKSFTELIEELALEDARAEKAAKKKRKRDKDKKGSKSEKSAKCDKGSKSGRDAKGRRDSKDHRDAKDRRDSKGGKSSKGKKGSKGKKRS